MKNPLLKDTFREIGKTKGRFFSIFAIITLGVSFFTGIKAASPVMKNTSDKYYDDKNLMDITVPSTRFTLFIISLPSFEKSLGIP